jgi:hypothetical protein
MAERCRHGRLRDTVHCTVSPPDQLNGSSRARGFIGQYRPFARAAPRTQSTPESTLPTILTKVLLDKATRAAVPGVQRKLGGDTILQHPFQGYNKLGHTARNATELAIGGAASGQAVAALGSKAGQKPGNRE